ncbi:hypothetical protein H2248_006604 [Termitomyces sp. 'cryptogamus']|nr:hypothetical protein H2248_006604 [Termitomyces sp. 'cryptogamus']
MEGHFPFDLRGQADIQRRVLLSQGLHLPQMDPDTLQKPARTIAAPQPLPPSTPSPLLVPPIPFSKPPSTAPVDIDPQSQAHADLLAELGIKVRDFAYESKLPPVQPYRVRQIQPGPRPLKRSRKDGEEDVSTAIETAEGSLSRKSKLKREDTEPDVTQHQPRRPRTLGFFNVRCDPDANPSQSQPAEYSQLNNFSQSQPLDSQDSDPYVVTPTVTPNGSLQWPDATISEIPASQLDTVSQANDPELFTYSQLGMSEAETEYPDTTGTGLVGILTPMSSLSSLASDVLPRFSNPFDSQPSNTYSRSSTASPSPQQSATQTSRYQLRRRPIPHSPQSPTKTGIRDRKSMYKAAYPLPRNMPYSMQSANAPLDRVIRNRGSSGNHDETMIVQ